MLEQLKISLIHPKHIHMCVFLDLNLSLYEVSTVQQKSFTLLRLGFPTNFYSVVHANYLLAMPANRYLEVLANNERKTSQ